MKKLFLLLYILFISKSKAQEWVTPIIDGYGKIKYSKNIAVQPDNNLEYKIDYKITTSETREGINKGLNGIAHAINMLGCVNIQNDKVKIAATIQGQATTIILNDNAYRKKFGKDNPNTEVISLLSDYGVVLYGLSNNWLIHLSFVKFLAFLNLESLSILQPLYDVQP